MIFIMEIRSHNYGGREAPPSAVCKLEGKENLVAQFSQSPKATGEGVMEGRACNNTAISLRDQSTEIQEI